MPGFELRPEHRLYWFSLFIVLLSCKQKSGDYTLNQTTALVFLTNYSLSSHVRGQLKRHDTCAETRFCLSAKRTSPFKSAGASFQSTTGSQGVRISGSNAEYTMFRGGVKGTGYPLHSPVSPSLPLACVTVCHHISTGVYCAEF